MAPARRPPGGRRLRRGARRRRVVPRRGLRLSAVSTFSGTVHRQTGVETPAFPPDRPAPTDGRYHRRGEPWPLYASLEPATTWAEWRAASGGAVDPADERRRLWRIEADRLRVIDLRDPKAVAELGVRLGTLTAGRTVPQALARRARRLGAEGLIVPSAARDGAWNLVVLPAGFGRLRVRGSRTQRPRPPR